MNPGRFYSTIRILVFGWHTRYVVRIYLQHLTIVAAGLMIAALCIDISSQTSDIINAPPAATGAGIPIRLLWYFALRSVDIGTKLLPVCCFLGILSAEVALARGRERLVISGSGRTPFQCALPALLLGLGLGCILFAVDTYLRPASMAAQASERLGEDGRRLNRSPTSMRHWFVAADKIVSANLDFGPPARLRNVTIYQVSNDGHLLGVIAAETANSEGESTEWQLDGGQGWSSSDDARKLQNARIGTVDIGLNPLWLTYSGISPMYLPQSVLEALARAKDQSFDHGEYQMWIYMRCLDLILPACMMLLACSLALALLSNGITFERVFVLAITGYFMHVLTRAFVLLGEQGRLPPSLAAFLAPSIAIVLIVGVLLLTYLRGIGWFVSPTALSRGSRPFLFMKTGRWSSDETKARR